MTWPDESQQSTPPGYNSQATFFSTFLCSGRGVGNILGRSCNVSDDHNNNLTTERHAKNEKKACLHLRDELPRSKVRHYEGRLHRRHHRRQLVHQRVTLHHGSHEKRRRAEQSEARRSEAKRSKVKRTKTNGARGEASRGPSIEIPTSERKQNKQSIGADAANAILETASRRRCGVNLWLTWYSFIAYYRKRSRTGRAGTGEATSNARGRYIIQYSSSH